jgi:ankyrin repeat protein
MRLNFLLPLISLFVGFSTSAKSGPQIQKLISAAREGDLKEVKTLAGHMDLNTSGDQKTTALMQASQSGKMDVVQFLVKKNVNLNAKNEAGETALSLAVQQEENVIAESLIQAGAETDVSCGDADTSLLMCATKTNAIPIIRLILKNSPKTALKKDKSGKIALDLAKEFGTEESVKILQGRH